MPYIKRKKPGAFPAWGGSNAYEYVEVDQFGNPIPQQPIQEFIETRNIQPPRSDMQTKTPSLTEPKIAPGIRAPDTIKGYSKPFDYHLWNTLRKQGRVAKKK